jgi:hypothetical protein
MAQRIVTTLIDDTDGSPADETVSFALDGITYEIDLSAKNAAALKDAVGAWASKARSSGNTRRTLKAVGDSRSALIRAWAAKEGITVPARGRIPNDVQRRYDAQA